MTAILNKILCPHCEGTGKEINRFDPPIGEATHYRGGPVASTRNVTVSGREIGEEPCPSCNGTLEVYNI